MHPILVLSAASVAGVAVARRKTLRHDAERVSAAARGRAAVVNGRVRSVRRAGPAGSEGGSGGEPGGGADLVDPGEAVDLGEAERSSADS